MELIGYHRETARIVDNRHFRVEEMLLLLQQRVRILANINACLDGSSVGTFLLLDSIVI